MKGWIAVLAALVTGLWAASATALRPALAGVCSPGSNLGDGLLEPFDLHFVVLVDPEARPGDSAQVPTPGSSHVDPRTGRKLQGAQWFEAEAALIQAQLVDERGKGLCVGNDCVRVQYRSHTFLADVDPHACPGLYALARRDPTSAPLRDVEPLARAVELCRDPALHRPGAINVYLVEAGRETADGPHDLAGHHPSRPFFFLDIDRAFTADRGAVGAAEEHAVGRLFGLRPICEPGANERTRNNPMQASCGALAHHSRTGHFEHAARDGQRHGDIDQVRRMVEVARRIQERWRGC